MWSDNSFFNQNTFYMNKQKISLSAIAGKLSKSVSMKKLVVSFFAGAIIFINCGWSASVIGSYDAGYVNPGAYYAHPSQVSVTATSNRTIGNETYASATFHVDDCNGNRDVAIEAYSNDLDENWYDSYGMCDSQGQTMGMIEYHISSAGTGLAKVELTGPF